MEAEVHDRTPQSSPTPSRVTAVILMFLFVLGIKILAPGIFQAHSDPANFYARIIQQRQTLRIFLDHPVFGVGFMNFVQVAEYNPRYAPASLNGVESENHPQNNLGAILAETGAAGELPYIASQVLLFMAFLRLRRTGGRGEFVWKYFFFIFLSYWINGMALAAGYYGDPNMWVCVCIYAALQVRSKWSDRETGPYTSDSGLMDREGR